NVTWVRELNRRYGLSIAATDVYSHPTVSAFADHILKQGKLRGLFLPDQRAENAAPAVAVKQAPVSAMKAQRGPEQVSHTAEVMEDRLDACSARLDAQKRLAQSPATPRPERASVTV